MPVHVDLVDPQTFDGDEPVGICAVPHAALPGPIEELEWRYVSERLWNRVLKLGEAYELHFAQVVEPVIDTVLVAEQCESLVQELAFLANMICDPALRHAIGIISAQAQRVTREPEFRLVLSPP